MRKKSIYIYKRETKDEYANEKMIELVKRYLVHIYIHIYIYMYIHIYTYIFILYCKLFLQSCTCKRRMLGVRGALNIVNFFVKVGERRSNGFCKVR